MAKAKKAQKTIDSWKRKRWHRVLAPKMFNEQEIGRTPALEAGTLNGRTIAASLMTLTRDMKQAGTAVTFEINRVQGDTAFTRVKEIEITPSAIKRLVRRQRDRIEDSFVVATKDNINVRIKPFAITKNLANNSVGTAIRKTFRTEINRIVGKVTYDTLISDVISRRMQNGLRSTLNKIFPLRNCEIRKLTLLPNQEIPDTLMQGEHQEAPLQKQEENKPSTEDQKAREDIHPHTAA